MIDYPYKVYNPAGALVMSGTEACRYPRHIELDLLGAGYTIRLHVKRITKRI